VEGILNSLDPNGGWLGKWKAARRYEARYTTPRQQRTGLAVSRKYACEDEMALVRHSRDGDRPAGDRSPEVHMNSHSQEQHMPVMTMGLHENAVPST
jgi:hypothetical protein